MQFLRTRDASDLSAACTSPASAWVQSLGSQPLCGRYALQHVIGTGGASVVFSARDLMSERNVAVKALIPHQATGVPNVARFEREAQIAAKLRHRHIVDLLDVGWDGRGVAFLVMELLEGRTLRDAVRERGPFSEAEALSSLLPVFGAVAFAHGQGVLHRDLKPENIFLARDERGEVVPKLLDFSIAKGSEEGTLTVSGAVLGTPAFMSPEQALAEPLCPASDVWSLGAVMFFALTGKLPFQADSLSSMLLNIVNKAAPPVRSVHPSIPLRFSLAVDRAIRRDARARYADVPSFVRALLETAHDDAVELPEDPDPEGLPEYRSWRAELDLRAITRDCARVAAPTVAVRSSRRLRWGGLCAVLVTTILLTLHALASSKPVSVRSAPAGAAAVRGGARSTAPVTIQPALPSTPNLVGLPIDMPRTERPRAPAGTASRKRRSARLSGGQPPSVETGGSAREQNSIGMKGSLPADAPFALEESWR